MKRLVRFWHEWTDAAATPRMRWPTALQFPVNDICNSRCQMCHIWQQHRDYEMSPAELRAVLADPLFRRIESVGINGGEPTLRKDLGELLQALIDRLPRLRMVSLITNAIRAPRCIEAIKELGEICHAAGKHLDVMVSLDGIGEVHDRVRGVAGNFQSALQVIDFLQATSWADSRRIGCTIVAENAYEVEEVLAFARGRGIYARFRLGIPHQRLYTADLKEPFRLEVGARYHVAAFLDTLVHEYETEPVRRAFYRSLRDQLIYGAARTAGCVWKNHGVTLGPRGDLAYCAVASPKLGNVRSGSAELLYWHNRSQLQEILAHKCADCRHDYEGIGSRRLLLRGYLGRLARRLPPGGQNLLRGAADRIRRAEEWVATFGTWGWTGRRPKRTGSGRVLLCGWYGTETLGDKAILAGLCGLLRRVRPALVVDVASLEPYVTRETCRQMPEMGIGEVVSLAVAMDRCRLAHYGIVAVAGGPLMTPVRELIDLARLLSVAKRHGATTALLGCGLGPVIRSGPRHAAIRRLVSDSDVCLLRDTDSVRLAQQLGRGDAQASIDPAFFWSQIRPDTPVVTGRPARPRVALALRDWQLESYAADLPETTARALKERLEQELLVLVDTLSEHADLSLVCMHTLAVGGDDRWFYRKLLAARPTVAAKIQWRRRSPAEELDLLKEADGVVAMRFHSVVLALALGKPMIVLDYTRGGKIAGLLRDTDNRDCGLTLEGFSGAQTALRLMAEIAAGRRPKPVRLEQHEKVYRASIETLLAGDAGMTSAVQPA